MTKNHLGDLYLLATSSYAGGGDKLWPGASMRIMAANTFILSCNMSSLCLWLFFICYLPFHFYIKHQKTSYSSHCKSSSEPIKDIRRSVKPPTTRVTTVIRRILKTIVIKSIPSGVECVDQDNQCQINEL